MSENIDELKRLLEQRTSELEECRARLRDLTARKRADEALRLVEERFHSAFRNTSACMALASPDGSFIEVNPAFCRFLGYTMDELMKLTVEEITHPDDWEETRRLRAEAAAGQTPTFSLEKRYLRKDGATVWGHASTTWFYDDDGAPVYNVALIQDITEQKRMEGALRESEAKFAKAFQATPTWLVISTLEEGRFIEINNAFERICGYRREEVVGRTSLELDIWVTPEDRSDIIRTLLKGEKVRNREVNFKGKGGKVFVGLLSAEIIEVNGEKHLLSLVNDITGRKRAEEALRRGEMRYRAIVEAFDGLIYICSQDYRIEFMNDRLIQRTGYDATGEPCYKALHDLDAVCPWCVNDRVTRGETVRWEVLSPRDNRWYYVVNTPIFNPDGTVSKQAMILDITERKQAEKAFKESHTLLEKTLASLNDAVIILTPENREILDCNATAERIFGYAREEMIGQKADLLHVNEAMFETFVRESLKAFESRGFYETEFEMRRKGGEVFPTGHFMRPVCDDAGKIEYIVGVVRDNTEWKRTMEEIEILDTNLASRAFELELANRDLEAFSYTVSHDLRSPLTKINGYSQILLELGAGALDERSKGYIRHIHEASLRMDQLISTILNFSRMTRCEINRDKVDLSGIAKTVAAELRLAEPERRMTFNVAEGVTADGDAKLLRVVLENLLGNAWKYTCKKEEALIEFGVSELEGKPAYFVRDDGAGFDMAEAGKLFGAFQRLHGKDEFEGHGIGLATVQRIIQRHGGRVWAESESGKGATFYFTL